MLPHDEAWCGLAEERAVKLLCGGRRCCAQLVSEQRAQLVVDAQPLRAVVARREHFHQVPIAALAERRPPEKRARRSFGGV